MVYAKEDGSIGFSWQKQYEFLVREHPGNLEDIVQTKFDLLQESEPENTQYYESLSNQLTQRISSAWDENPTEFGYAQSDQVVKQFIADNDLNDLFADVPTI